jgi:hypothetical protein
LVCASAFFIILSATLFYSFGYKYDFSTGKSFQTGAIVLKAVPTDVVITKDGQEVKLSGFLNGIWSTFVKIENLETKSYNIQVDKAGYNGWRKNIPIIAGQVGKYESIVLLKKEYKNLPVFEGVTLQDRTSVWSDAGKNRLILYATLVQVEGLYMLDIENEKQELILDKTQLTLMGKVDNVLWTDDDSKILVSAAGKLYVIDLRDGNKAYLISDGVAALLRQPGSEFSISDKSIVYLQAGSISTFDYETKETKVIKANVAGFDAYQGQIYYFKTDDVAPGGPTLYSFSLSVFQSDSQISVMPTGFDPKVPFVLERGGDSATILSAGMLYLIDNNAETHKLNSNVKKSQFFQAGKRILYWGDNEIWIYYVEDKENQPIKRKGENELLSRFSGKLSNVYLYADEEHIFYQENGIFSFTELDERDNRNTFKVFDNPDGENIYYVRGKSFLYFIKDNTLFKIDLKEV